MRKGSRKVKKIPLAPPAFGASIVVTKTFRYESLAGTTSDITQTSLLDSWFMATTTLAGYRIVAAARIRRVTMWAPMDASLVPVTCSVQWPANASFGGVDKIKSDTSMGATVPARLSTKPPIGSLAYQWSSGSVGTAILCTLVYPINTIVDVDISYVVQNGQPPTAVTSAVFSATVGQVYLRPIDDANVLIPVSYPTN